MSAKTDDLINALFLRVTAEVLGLKLSHTDLDRAATVVKADIVRPKDASKEPKKPQGRTKSSFCVLQ